MQIRDEKELIDGFNYCTLKEMRKKVDKLIEEYGETATFNIEEAFRPYDPHPYIKQSVIYCREETEEERKERIAKEREWAEMKRERDLAQLEQLKKEYENG